MTKQRRNALMMLALTLIYSGLQFSRPTLNVLNITTSLLIPVAAIIFALNLKDPRWRWPLITLEALALLLMIVFAWTHLA